MKSLCIKTNNSILLDYLLNEFKTIDIDNVCFCSNSFKCYKNVIIHYTGKDTEDFVSKISYILSFLVIDELEDDLLKRTITQNYFYFNFREKQTILQNCFDLMLENFSNLFDTKLHYLYSNFYNFILSNKSIVLDGFINFRIKNYMNILNDIVEEAVNSFIIEKEYLEFISLLKLYINSQKSGSNVIHLIYNSTNSFLLDENKLKIELDDSIFKAKYLSDISFSDNDYILNYLLNSLPNTIYVHLIDNYIDEFINTLQLVFENRIKICTDCSICEIYKLQHIEKSNLFNSTKKSQ